MAGSLAQKSSEGSRTAGCRAEPCAHPGSPGDLAWGVARYVDMHRRPRSHTRCRVRVPRRRFTGQGSPVGAGLGLCCGTRGPPAQVAQQGNILDALHVHAPTAEDGPGIPCKRAAAVELGWVLPVLDTRTRPMRPCEVSDVSQSMVHVRACRGIAFGDPACSRVERAAVANHHQHLRQCAFRSQAGGAAQMLYMRSLRERKQAYCEQLSRQMDCSHHHIVYSIKTTGADLAAAS